jgi:hypothetical protein
VFRVDPAQTEVGPVKVGIGRELTSIVIEFEVACPEAHQRLEVNTQVITSLFDG